MSVRCSDCGRELEDIPGRTSAPPCPKCGGTRRTFEVSLFERAEARDGLGYKLKRPGSNVRKSIISEGTSRFVPSQKARLVKVERHIDRLNDRYMERVTDVDSGAVIHECQEPLNAHVGHGSAKGPGVRDSGGGAEADTNSDDRAQEGKL